MMDRWFCTSIVGTGSILAAKLNSLNAPSGCRLAALFTWWPSTSEKLAVIGDCSKRTLWNAIVRPHRNLPDASGSIGVPSA